MISSKWFYSNSTAANDEAKVKIFFNKGYHL